MVFGVPARDHTPPPVDADPRGRARVSNLFELGIIAFLILLNGLFVLAEIALVTARKSRLQQLADEGDPGARRVSRLLDKPGDFLAVIQLGITFIGFLAAAFAGQSLVASLEVTLTPALGGSAGIVALLIVTVVISLVTIVFGELVPKTLGIAHAERFAIVFARPVTLLGRIFAPIVWLLTGLTSVITRLMGVKAVDRDRITADELMILVERGGEQGIIEAEEEQMIGAVLELGQRRVHEVMVPRIDIVGLPLDASLDQIVDTIVAEGHSRIPVYEESVDNIVGILYAKDLLPYLKGEDNPPPVRTMVRAPLFVPESMNVDDLLHSLQRRKVHIAIVLDEYGGTAGLVTIEDLIEEIVGEIQDEYDVEEPMLVALSEDEARVDGRASVDDLAEHFDIEFDPADREEYDTVGGLVYHRIGTVPRVGDVIEVDGVVRLTVEVDRRAARGEGAGGPHPARDRRGDRGRRRRLSVRSERLARRQAARWRRQAEIADSTMTRRRVIASPSTTPAASSWAIASSRWKRARSRVNCCEPLRSRMAMASACAAASGVVSRMARSPAAIGRGALLQRVDERQRLLPLVDVRRLPCP